MEDDVAHLPKVISDALDAIDHPISPCQPTTDKLPSIKSIARVLVIGIETFKFPLHSIQRDTVDNVRTQKPVLPFPKMPRVSTETTSE